MRIPEAVEPMNMSGMASSSVLMTIVALGAAAGLAVEPDSDHRYLAPSLVTHRGPPGAAQIELAESVPLSTVPRVEPASDEPALALLGVGTSKAVDKLCDSALAAGKTGPENLMCELSSRAVKHVPNAGSDYLSLLLVTR